MFRQHSTGTIQQTLCLTPQQQSKLKWTAGCFILGATIVYGGALFGKECESSFKLSSEELYEFMQQSMNWLLPTSGATGLLAGLLGYKKAEQSSRLPLDQHLEPFVPALPSLNIQTKSAREPAHLLIDSPTNFFDYADTQFQEEIDSNMAPQPIGPDYAVAVDLTPTRGLSPK
jgi:hypothetical protein